MATLTIRNLPDEVRLALKSRAAQHNRSMEAEVRDILEDAVTAREDFVTNWMAETAVLRGEFELPERSAARPVDLS